MLDNPSTTTPKAVHIPEQLKTPLKATADGKLFFFGKPIPAILFQNGQRQFLAFLSFFHEKITNNHTQQAYAHAIIQFLQWSTDQGYLLHTLDPNAIQKYTQTKRYSNATLKQHLAAIRRFFDWLITKQILEENPALPVKGPSPNLRRGKTPPLTAEEARTLLGSIHTENVVGARDHALVSIMLYGFAKVSTAISMQVKDFTERQGQYWLCVPGKDNTFHKVPAHSAIVISLQHYLKLAGIADDSQSPLFRSVRGRMKAVTERGMHRSDVLRMIKRRALDAGLKRPICCHSFRATGISRYLEQGGNLEQAQSLAAHESPRTTRQYHPRPNTVSRTELERIQF